MIMLKCKEKDEESLSALQKPMRSLLEKLPSLLTGQLQLVDKTLQYVHAFEKQNHISILLGSLHNTNSIYYKHPKHFSFTITHCNLLSGL